MKQLIRHVYKITYIWSMCSFSNILSGKRFRIGPLPMPINSVEVHVLIKIFWEDWDFNPLEYLCTRNIVGENKQFSGLNWATNIIAGYIMTGKIFLGKKWKNFWESVPISLAMLRIKVIDRTKICRNFFHFLGISKKLPLHPVTRFPSNICEAIQCRNKTR